MEEAEGLASSALVVLGAETSEAAKLQEGMVEALELGRDTVRMVRRVLARDGEECDVKLLRLGNDTGMAICRLGMRVAEGMFRVRRDDALARLLASLARDGEDAGGR